MTDERGAQLAWPRRRGLLGAVHGVLHHARDVGDGVVGRAHAAGADLLADAETRGRRLIHAAGDEARGVVADADRRMGRQREELLTGGQRLLDSFFDRVLATALAVAVLVASHYYRHVAHHHEDDPMSTFSLFWTGTTLMTVMLFLVSKVAGQSRRLRHLIAWECYIIALGGVLAAALLIVRRLAAAM